MGFPLDFWIFFILKSKLDPTIPTLLGNLFTYTMCHRYLSGLITIAHHCLLKQYNTSVRELIPSAGMPHSGLPALLCGMNCPSSPGRAILFNSGRILTPWLPPLFMPPRIGHIIQGTLPDQSLVERWVYDPSPANHSGSRTSQSYFWSHYLSATYKKLAGWKSRAIDVICVPMWGQPAWEWCQSRDMHSQDMETKDVFQVLTPALPKVGFNNSQWQEPTNPCDRVYDRNPAWHTLPQDI